MTSEQIARLQVLRKQYGVLKLQAGGLSDKANTLYAKARQLLPELTKLEKLEAASERMERRRAYNASKGDKSIDALAERLGIRRRYAWALVLLGATTVEQIARLSRSDICTHRISRRALKELREELAVNGLSFPALDQIERDQ